MTTPSRMMQEALAAPDAVRRLLDPADATGAAALDALVARLAAAPPPFAMTVARGSSDHAAAYGRYLFETRMGLVTAAAAPSVVTAYGAGLRLAGAFVLTVSQSGESPDLLRVTEAARAGGAVTAALVNAADSPLAGLAEHVLPLRAGPETSVAATGTVIASLAALARLTGRLCGDAALAASLDALPDRLALAAAADWDAGLPALADVHDLLVVARGLTLPVAREMALKFKETAAMHAEPFSSAELRHGPMALVEPGFPVLVVATADATLAGVLDTARALKDAGAHLLVAAADPGALALADTPLPLPAPLHPALDPIVAVQAFYPFMARLARHRGSDPDRPRHLRKVTRTV
ncbi:SIS domain-containing protein [Azospirillum halopraeferens]|uniref:SIS domain-containing protein n=1 Tax=Azospirillum halopraeferens TaxID=34010 RepID=UPI00040237AB|nr:SIS domain-containing protein [Azospirillum halopraeferens]